METLRTVNLTKNYKDGSDIKTVLDNVNISINRGEFIGIFGPSGSGKSTLLNLIGGLTRPTKGQIFLEGNRIDHLNPDFYSKNRKNSPKLIENSKFEGFTFFIKT